MKNALFPVIVSGALGGAVSTVLGLLGSVEQPTINPAANNPTAKIAANSFFISAFQIRIFTVIRVSIRNCYCRDGCFRSSVFTFHCFQAINFWDHCTTDAMNSYLERLQRELEDATRNADTVALAQAPAGKWSAAQILEHLFLTFKHTSRGLAKCLEQDAPMAARPTLKDRLATILVLNLGYIPSGRKAPERATPRGTPPEEVQPAIVAELQRMASSLDDCERKFGRRAKIMDHPSLGPLTANEWRKFHWAHGRHHARQIRERIGKS